MAVRPDNLKAFLERYIDTNKIKLKDVCKETNILAEQAKSDYISSIEKPNHTYAPLCRWVENVITIHSRPGWIKSASSLERKVNKVINHDNPFWKHIEGGEYDQADQILTNAINDLTGVEVRFPSSSMILPYRDFLLDSIRQSHGEQHPHCQDYLSTPQDDGYRAYHVFFELKGFITELQLKTHQAKFWEYYSHDLFYHQEGNPKETERLRMRLNSLATLNAACEAIGAEIIEDYTELYRAVNRPVLATNRQRD